MRLIEVKNIISTKMIMRLPLTDTNNFLTRNINTTISSLKNWQNNTASTTSMGFSLTNANNFTMRSIPNFHKLKLITKEVRSNKVNIQNSKDNIPFRYDTGENISHTFFRYENMSYVQSVLQTNIQGISPFTDRFTQQKKAETTMRLVYRDLLIDVLEERARTSNIEMRDIAILHAEIPPQPRHQTAHTTPHTIPHTTPHTTHISHIINPLAFYAYERINIEAKLGESEKMERRHAEDRGLNSKGRDFGASVDWMTLDGYLVVCPREARRFVANCMGVVGESKRNSLVIAEHLISSDEKNFRNYGLKALGYFSS